MAAGQAAQRARRPAMNGVSHFVFCTERRLVVLTGRRACNLPRLLAHLAEVGGASIFYHTHDAFLAHHFEKPSFHNDFADWANTSLRQPALAERLAAIDLLAFPSIRELREAIIGVVRAHLAANPGQRDCLPGQEFHFCKSKSFTLPTGLVAYDAPDFFRKLVQVSTVSLFFHFFEARLRLGHPTNDFSWWLEGLGQNALAGAIDRLNPYVLTLDELKQRILDLGAKPELWRDGARA